MSQAFIIHNQDSFRFSIDFISYLSNQFDENYLQSWSSSLDTVDMTFDVAICKELGSSYIQYMCILNAHSIWRSHYYVRKSFLQKTLKVAIYSPIHTMQIKCQKNLVTLLEYIFIKILKWKLNREICTSICI